MTSISPHPGHGTESMFAPSAQTAGHSPVPAGTRRRVSIRPYRTSTLPFVMMRADV
jgi:hypothetical protein